MRVLLITSWDEPCGIADHSAMLIDAVTPQGIDIRVGQGVDGYDRLHPKSYNWKQTARADDVVHLNYHAAKHSLFTFDVLREMKAAGCRILLTLHDSGTPNTDDNRMRCALADWFVVHEPYDDLPPNGEYLRMGVLPLSGRQYSHHRERGRRPILGTVGHDFGFKCWDELARTAASVGWGMRICTPKLDEGHFARLEAANPWLEIQHDLSRDEVVEALHGCDATAFTYVCHNTGQSGPLLFGVAARKPVIALSTCRMFRALYTDRLGFGTIRWCETFDDVRNTLLHMTLGRLDPGIVALAEQESWSKVGARYAEIYRSLCA